MNAADGERGAAEQTEVPVDFRKALGAGLRRLRLASGRTQDNVARAARTVGLSWDRSKVAAVERADKAVSAEELVLLPLVLRRAEIHFNGMADLFGESLQTQIRISRAIRPLLPTDLIVLLRGFAGFLDEDGEGKKERRGLGAGIGALIPVMPPEPPTVSVPDPDEEDAAIRRAVKLGFGDVSYDRFRRALAQSGEAEEKAARKFGETKLVIAAVSAGLWGRSLTAERDARVSKDRHASGSSDLSDLTVRQVARKAQAVRGHHTRKLLTEMELILRGAKRERVVGYMQNDQDEMVSFVEDIDGLSIVDNEGKRRPVSMKDEES